MSWFNFLLLIPLVISSRMTTSAAAADAQRASYSSGAPISSSAAVLLTVEAAVSHPFEQIGTAIKMPFPNQQAILGVGGLTYHRDIDIWTASSENIIGTKLDIKYPVASVPRLYHMKLDFNASTVEFLFDEPVFIEPSDGLKIEDMDSLPVQIGIDPLERDIWLVSEANSKLSTTNIFLSKDFGSPDLNTFDPDTFSTSRLIRVDSVTGVVYEEAVVPSFAQWDRTYDWESMNCVGDRPFQGLHALSIIPSLSGSVHNYTMFVGIQTALYQDGDSPTEFSDSATRILVYGVNASATGSSSSSRYGKTSEYLRSYRYDTTHLTMKSYQKGARHFNALFGLLAIDEASLLVVECEDLTGFGSTGQKIMNRIFYVELNITETIDHCVSLLDCSIEAPSKYLVWERMDDVQLDGIAWGPVAEDGRPTVALTFENDDKVGLHLELYALDLARLKERSQWSFVENKDYLLRKRLASVTVTLVLFIILAIFQFIIFRKIPLHHCFRHFRSHQSSKELSETDDLIQNKALTDLKGGSVQRWSQYAIVSAMLNSFLVGGLTFGYSGMVLILRKEGIYAENCACGSFCAKQKEQLALISTVGFASAIGSRLFIGLFMDRQGPKTTALLCSAICLSGFLILASSDDKTMSTNFLPAWILLSLGGSGLHLTGFHFTNLFSGDGKKKASAGISAAFGASSAIFPIMQVLNQYANIRLKTLSLVYSIIVGMIMLNNLFIQPWNKVSSRHEFEEPTLNVFQARWWHRDIKVKPLLSSISVEIVKFAFWGEALFYSVSLLLLTHYLSTSAQLLYEKGDIPFTSNPNDWTDYIITRMAGWFNALGFVWLPTVQYIIVKLHWPQCYALLAVTNIIVFVIVLIKNLEVQILGFFLLSFGRLALFSCHHTYLLDVFGIEFFGTLNGISSLIAAIIGFTSYPLQIFALVTNYSFSFIPITVCIVLSVSFPVLLRKQHFKNWAETVTVDPKLFRYPRSISEVQDLVQSHDKIRCAGALHSCAPLIVSDGIIISLTKMDKIIHINADNLTVQCQSGVRIHDLCNALAPYGLAMGTLGTIDWQTISGAVMTGTHGGALTIPSLHSFVTSYTIVRPDASIVTVTKESDPVLFSALAPSMGVFGVVVEMEIQCVPLEILEAKFEVISFDELASGHAFNDVMENNKYARVVVYPSINKVTLWKANPVSSVMDAVSRGATDCSGGYMNFRNENEKAWLEQYVSLCKKKKYVRADKLLHKVLTSQQSRLHHYVGQYNHVLCKERNNGIPHADIEFNFDYAKCSEVLNAVRGFCENNRVPYYNFEIRTTKQDDAMLSCCNGRDSMWIDFQAKAEDSHEFFDAMEKLLKPIGFRKHWAKGLGNTDPKYVVNQFSGIQTFINLMADIDPNGKFRNREGDLWYKQMSEILAEAHHSHIDK